MLLCHAQPSTDKPFFAQSAVYVYGGRVSRSPDGTKSVRVVQLNDENLTSTATVSFADRELHKQVLYGLNVQVLWSPDSKAFALTGSDTGANGEYRTDVFALDGTQLNQISLTKLVQREFGHPVVCEVPELPNVVAIKWLQPSIRLLVAAQIVPHTVCDSGGTFKAYDVDVQNRRIVRVFGQLETKKLFGPSLGEWLLAARDECVTNPKSCEVPFHHQVPPK